MRIAFMFFQLTLLNSRWTTSHRKLRPCEIQSLQGTLNADWVNGSIRLREGEYQYDLAKTIASFELELHLPDVQGIIKRAYGEEKGNDIQFVRKIQTILKKMEKSNIVKILPKEKPWELQRYALSGFKFKDSEKNLVTLATDEQIKQAQNLLHSISDADAFEVKPSAHKARAYLLLMAIVASYVIMVWDLMQPLINPIILTLAIAIAIACSIMLGRVLARD